MSRKAFIKEGLKLSRGFTNRMLDKFEKDSDWLYQVHPEANHAMWCAGHIALVDEFFVKLTCPEKAIDLSADEKLFGMGTKPVSDASAYPTPAEIRKRLSDSHERLLGVLEGLSEDDLDKPTPEGSPDFLPTLESVFRLAVFHEGVHAGQMSIANRGLGHAPLIG
ncbi:MAG TPA: DinB family protein [Phycisphaerae bacterium]|nr:DinB family protein [Phycisphaerae bacterium]